MSTSPSPRRLVLMALGALVLLVSVVAAAQAAQVIQGPDPGRPGDVYDAPAGGGATLHLCKTPNPPEPGFPTSGCEDAVVRRGRPLPLEDVWGPQTRAVPTRRYLVFTRPDPNGRPPYQESVPVDWPVFQPEFRVRRLRFVRGRMRVDVSVRCPQACRVRASLGWSTSRRERSLATGDTGAAFVGSWRLRKTIRRRQVPRGARVTLDVGVGNRPGQVAEGRPLAQDVSPQKYRGGTGFDFLSCFSKAPYRIVASPPETRTAGLPKDCVATSAFGQGFD